MADKNKVFDAIRNCITEPKCKNCPWKECEKIDNKRVEVPVTLMLDVLELLKEQKPKKGHWILDPDGMDWGLPAWRCSECGGQNACLPIYIGGKPVKNIYRWAGSQYCPNCGAKMEVTEE